MNVSHTQYFPFWYIINDLFIVLFNLITFSIGTVFVLLVVRKKKLRTIMNILSSNSCLCGSLLAFAILWDSFYMIKSDITGIARQDRNCVIRNICMLTTMIALNYSLCLQTYHRFITIVYSQQTSLRSMNFYIKILIIQWFIYPFLLLPIILSNEIVYQPGSFVCQISFSNIPFFIYLFILSYGIPLIFIIILHVCMIYYIQKHWKSHRQRRLTSIYVICPLQRIVLITLVLIISYLPCGIFFIYEHLYLTVIPYAQKIILLFASLSFALTMILTFGFNRSVRRSSFSLFHRTNRQMIKHIVYRPSRK
ncbi:unnamed protein product [Adineta steineri]|uniref:G-protein coupled receptors family 1 profile domain-containing protein n=1 Tax=Adineta steineri TaxID=433720 RepID=A0A815MWL3_9BILA|nr:unnamed protein product [Adineta steineri]CAF1428953.1 unnamed protein product [Adineta steineri]CAF1460834.1 unnamed protein product [Adineta steineri]CAF1488970.1 unnamed protein product [Adineta steineri]CAF1623642.1 unnamed protein product [Adineta steineri]